MKKNQAYLVLLAAILSVFLLSSFLTQESEVKYLTVKTIEFYGGVFDSKITVVDEMGKTEEYGLEKLRSKNLADNTKTINAVFNSLSKKGYTLVNSTSAGFGTDGLLNTFIFERK
jgi:hypothetical protein